MDEIPERIIYELKEINDIYKGNDWLVVKKLLIRSCDSKSRSYFSKRHGYSQKQVMNDFERNLIQYYENIYGIKLELANEKIHTHLDDQQYKRKSK